MENNFVYFKVSVRLDKGAQARAGKHTRTKGHSTNQLPTGDVGSRSVASKCEVTTSDSHTISDLTDIGFTSGDGIPDCNGGSIDS